MKQKIFTVDAFAESPFTGNPASVCIMEKWPEDSLMQNIAAENNLAETSFVVREGDGYRIRWFTPTVEVDLCGHATVASAFVLFNHYGLETERLILNSRSGPLSVSRKDDLFILDFPADKLQPTSLDQNIADGLGATPLEMFKGKTDLMLVFKSQKQIVDLKPDFGRIAKANCRGIIVTAPGEDCDFVSRFFAPQSGIDEDPVTGSAHTSLIPFWSKRLSKKEMIARQLSRRGGKLYCTDRGDRVLIGGKARLYLQGEIYLG